jgi:hypothetical protein
VPKTWPGAQEGTGLQPLLPPANHILSDGDLLDNLHDERASELRAGATLRDVSLARGLRLRAVALCSTISLSSAVK